MERGGWKRTRLVTCGAQTRCARSFLCLAGPTVHPVWTILNASINFLDVYFSQNLKECPLLAWDSSQRCYKLPVAMDRPWSFHSGKMFSFRSYRDCSKLHCDHLFQLALLSAVSMALLRNQKVVSVARKYIRLGPRMTAALNHISPWVTYITALNIGRFGLGLSWWLTICLKKTEELYIITK